MSVAGNSPLRFGASALEQQVDMWFRLRLCPNFASRRNFTYPQNVILNCTLRPPNKKFYKEQTKLIYRGNQNDDKRRGEGVNY